MTKADLTLLIGKRLGDTVTEFRTIIGEVLEQVLGEMAQNECLGSLRKEASYQFTAGTSSYSTGTITGLSAGPPQLFPMRVEKLTVPTWELDGLLQKEEDEARWDAMLSQWGSTYAARPQFWRIYPNETQLQVFPVPRADDVTASNLKILYWAPPAVLADADNISEIRVENFHVVIAGCIVYGMDFQDETIVDRARANARFQEGMALMRRQQQRARYGDIQRIRFNRFA